MFSFPKAGVTDVAVLVGAILHDTVEDTDTSLEEVEAEFGPEVVIIMFGLYYHPWL